MALITKGVVSACQGNKSDIALTVHFIRGQVSMIFHQQQGIQSALIIKVSKQVYM